MFLNRIVAGFCLLCCACSEQRPIVISVDFSAREQTKSLSGFLGTLSPDKVEEKLVRPLKPRLWRGGQIDRETRERVKSLGIRYVLMLSDGWGYPLTIGGGEVRPPFEDFAAWEAYVRNTARSYGREVLYDIWNEPDIPIFWGFWGGADFDSFLETYKRAHDVIRSELGEQAIIIGPGLSFFDTERLKKFADFCREQKLKVQVLSHHLLYQPDCRLPDVQRTLAELKKKYLGNPDYPFEEMQVNEFGMAYLQNARPGSVLAFLRHMEKAGVDGASRACWAHPDECSNPIDCLDWKKWKTCGDGTINGLFTPNHEPRAIWWAYMYYVDGAESRVTAESSDPELMPVASRSGKSPDQAQVLIASYGDGLDSATGPVKLELDKLNSLPFIDSDTNQIKVTIMPIPYEGRGEKAMMRLTNWKSDMPVPVVNGRAELVAGTVRPYEVLAVFISVDAKEEAQQ